MNREIVIKEIDYRPCYVKGKKALFHKYIKSNSLLLTEETHALVEYEDGQVDEVYPTLIKFTDNLINEFAFNDKEDNNE